MDKRNRKESPQTPVRNRNPQERKMHQIIKLKKKTLMQPQTRYHLLDKHHRNEGHEPTGNPKPSTTEIGHTD